MPRKAMVLAAGLGTRLRPLTARRPKPAMPLCGEPPLRFTLARLKAAGVEEVVINTHWLPEVIEQAVGDPAALGLTVHYSHEPQILGTGGGLKKAAEHFQDETFYLVNGKLLFDADLEGAVRFHRDHQALATMVLRPYPEGSRYSAIEIDDGGRIRRFVDQFEWAGPLTKCLFTGVHVLEPRVLEYLPPAIEVCINAWAYPRMIAADEVVCGYLQTEGYWAEPSTPARYLAAVQDLLAGRVELARFRAGGVDPFAGTTGDDPGIHVHPDAKVGEWVQLEPPCYVGPGVELGAGCEVGPGAAIEAGAVLEPGAVVTRSVVWPGTVIRGEERLDKVIALKGHRVPAASDD